MKWLIASNKHLLNYSLFLLRAITGLILFVVGAGKVAGWFGGIGIKTTLMLFQTKSDIPHWLAYLSCYTEFIGGFLLVIGLMTRPVAIFILINMTVAVMVSGPHHFFMGGAAYAFSLLINSLIIIFAGPGEYSLDAVLVRKSGSPKVR